MRFSWEGERFPKKTVGVLLLLLFVPLPLGTSCYDPCENLEFLNRPSHRTNNMTAVNIRCDSCRVMTRVVRGPLCKIKERWY